MDAAIIFKELPETFPETDKYKKPSPCHQVTTTHSEISDEKLREFGINDNLVRLSIGVEDWQDLLRDILQALQGGIHD